MLGDRSVGGHGLAVIMLEAKLTNRLNITPMWVWQDLLDLHWLQKSGETMMSRGLLVIMRR